MARIFADQKTQGEQEQSYLASVSDLMSGLMFIFVITLMVFALSLKGTQVDLREEVEKLKREKARLEEINRQREEEIRKIREEKRSLELLVDQLTGAKAVRARLLNEIRLALEQGGFRVQVDTEHGIVRLPEELLFPSGSAELQPEGKRMLDNLGRVLVEVLPRYTHGGSSDGDSVHQQNTDQAEVDAIFVEGHTDDVRVSSGRRFRDNWELSTFRAIETYQSLAGLYPDLRQFRNDQEMPLFSVSGYADSRPVVPNDSEENRQRNRRIDLRFIMTPPKVTPEILRAIEQGLIWE